MEQTFNKDSAKADVFSYVTDYLQALGLHSLSVDDHRPWGGFFVIDNTQTPAFVNRYFPQLSVSTFSADTMLSPKILVVEPGKRLSWQYHHRRAELWKIINGPVAVITSTDDRFQPPQILESGQQLQFKALIRHRLIGLETWGLVAEIWQHTDPQNLSDEADIVRVSDDFGR